MGLGISSMASVWQLLVCGANSELLGLAFKHPDHPTTTLFQTFLVLPQWPPSVCSTNYTASFFISLLVLLLSPTTSTLPRPLESLLIIKGNSTNLKGRRKENCTCLWDPMRNVADREGMGKADFWNGEKRVSWTPWKPSPGQGWWREAGGRSEPLLSLGRKKKKKSRLSNAHAHTQDPGSCTPWESPLPKRRGKKRA